MVVHEWNWMTFSLVQTKKCNSLSFSQLNLQMNLRVLESVGIDDAIQELNPHEIDTKVPTLPSWLEIEDHYYVLYEGSQPSQRVPRK